MAGMRFHDLPYGGAAVDVQSVAAILLRATGALELELMKLLDQGPGPLPEGLLMCLEYLGRWGDAFDAAAAAAQARVDAQRGVNDYLRRTIGESPPGGHPAT